MSLLGPLCKDERQRIRQQFETGVSARETLREFCELADRNIQQVFAEALGAHNAPAAGLCLLALVKAEPFANDAGIVLDTEGQKAIDVFYRTQDGCKLSPEFQDRIAGELRDRI